MTKRTTEEDRVAPGLFIAAFGCLLYLGGLFVMALLRGPNPIYIYVSGAAVVVFALGIAQALRVRARNLRARRHRGE